MKVLICCSASDKINQEYYDLTIQASEILSKRYDLVYGIYDHGMMKRTYDTFTKNGRDIYGVTLNVWKEDLNSVNLKEHYLVDTPSERNIELYKLADLIVCLPGSVGTLSEIMSMLEYMRTFNERKTLVIYNFNNYYDGLINLLNTMEKENMFGDKPIYYEVVDNIDKLNDVC